MHLAVLSQSQLSLPLAILQSSDTRSLANLGLGDAWSVAFSVL